MNLPSVISFAKTFELLFAQSHQQSSTSRTWYSPSWDFSWPIFILIVIAIVSFVASLYLRERGKKSDIVRGILIAIRVTLIMGTFFFLLGWTRNTSLTDLPDLVIAIDDSASMGVVDQFENLNFPELDDARLREQIETRIRGMNPDERNRLAFAKSMLDSDGGDWLGRLSKDFNIKLFRIGESTQAVKRDAISKTFALSDVSADGNASRLGDALSDILQFQRGQQTTAIVIFSDGLTTDGKAFEQAAQEARRESIPLFLVGMGSSVPPKDLLISDLVAEDAVFVRDLVTFDLKVNSTGFEDQKVSLNLRLAGSETILDQQELLIDSDIRAEPVRLTYRPEEKGEFDFVIEIETLDEESNKRNNRLEKTIRVRDEKINVLLVADYPSREFHYLKQLMSRSLSETERGDVRAIKLKTFLQQADVEYAKTDETALRVFPVRRDELFEFDVIIINDVRHSNSGLRTGMGTRELENIHEFITKLGKGLVVIAGAHNSTSLFGTPIESLLPFFINGVTAPDPNSNITESFPVRPTQLGWSWPPFQLGDDEAENKLIWSRLPGFFWSLNTPNLRPGARVLASHPTKTDSKGGPLPIISMQFVGNGKVVFHSSPESYRWRFRQRDKFFERYWLQLIRYLSRSKLTQGSNNIAVTTDRDSYLAGDSVTVSVKFFDDRKAPSSDTGVRAVIKRSGGTKESFGLTRDSVSRGKFETTLDNLAQGDYEISMIEPAPTGSPPTANFKITSANAETSRLAMNVGELKNVAKVTNGEFYLFENSEQLFEDVPKGQRIELVTLPPESVWNRWLLVTILGTIFIVLITVEWLVRKWKGML